MNLTEGPGRSTDGSTSLAMQQATAAYARGEWAEAERLCRNVLAAQGEYFDALSLLGVIAAQTRRTEEAVRWLGRAVAAKPGDAAAHSNYGNVLKALKRFDDALGSYQCALKLKPDYVVAHNNRGNTLQDLKRFEEALDSYERALRIKPDHVEAYYNRGNALRELKRFEEALDSYERALAIRPDYAEAHNNRGLTLHELKRFEEALGSYERALKINPGHAEACNNRGNALYALHRFEDALVSYEHALQINPVHAAACYNRGNALRELKRFQDALDSYERTLTIRPDYAEAHNTRGVTLQELKRFDDALESYQRALQIKPDYAEAHNNRAYALQRLKRFDEALECYDRALQIEPDYAEAHNNRAYALQKLKRFDEALECYDRALQIKPGYAEAHNNRANLMQELQRFDEAAAGYELALRIKPRYAEAHNNRANLLQELQRFEEAVTYYDRALTIRPDYAEAYTNRGLALHVLQRFDDALDSYARALRIDPDYADAHYKRGSTLDALKRFADALDSYGCALKIEPHCDWLYGTWLHAKMQLCDWSNFDSLIADLAARIQRAEKTTPPFQVLALIDSPSLQRRAAETWVTERHTALRLMPAIPRRGRHDRIRVGYFSGDYRNHPVAMLTAEMFEKHDRSRFEVHGFSLGPDTQDETRKRVERAFDRFLDVRSKSDLEIAQLARAMELDIAVDLGGFTEGSRPNLFAMRMSPLQVSYLGYLGTWGMDCMDYLIADPTIVPVEQQPYYAEKIVYLPSYQANDSKRVISDRTFTREELGLPQTGFVFCCFNANYKITPGTFDCWMRILRQVHGSVLFLFAGNSTVEFNLRKEALKRGVEADRLIFGTRLPVPEYVARYRTADLFLDTLPYNAGTTASDALWAGLPVLTRMGESFPARVAASLLNAVGLPELIATSEEQYEAMAIELAGDPNKLAELKGRLARNRLTTPLFDTQQFSRHLENAYAQIYERYQADLSPEHIFVAP